MGSDLNELAEAIVEWAADRPAWEQAALRSLAAGEVISNEHVTRLADIAEQQARGRVEVSGTISVTDLGHDGPADEQVCIRGVYRLQHVNALHSESGLDFSPEGITLVYGENGSGKSGFARILKTVTRARHVSDVLSNVFANPGDQSALLLAEVGSSRQEINWPSDDPTSLRRVSFYDSDCADRYVSADTEVAYRPWAISLLDSLVALSSRVRDELQRRQAERASEPPPHVVLPSGSRSARFFESLSADTQPFEIDMASELPADADDRLALLQERIRSLEAADHASRQVSLGQLLADTRDVRNHIRRLRERLSDEAAESQRRAAAEALQARTAAALASAEQFSAASVAGVGSDPWRRLWESARRYSEQVAFPGQPFPVVTVESEPAHCLLCHQKLVDGSSERLQSFEKFVAADTARDADEKEQSVRALIAEVAALDVLSTPIALALERIASESPEARGELDAELRRLEERRDELSVDPMPDDVAPVPLAQSPDFASVTALEARIQSQLADLSVEDSEQQLSQLRDEAAEITGRQLLREHRADLDLRVRRLREARVLDDAIGQTDTRGITRRAADLTRTHVSDVMKHQFSQETLLLDLRRVRLADAGGGQGNLRHRAQLVGAVQRAALDAVLSEGEQTALGLAGFLTEVESDPSRSAVILDDPVTSLDHVRQERVARRLVDLAMTRQVVIFTHDVAFMIDVKRAAEAASVPIEERWITRRL